MALFGKKEDPAEEIEEFEEGRKITRKLKDLNPENKKKRKEPPKPWGKKERIIVLSVLLVTTVFSAILLLRNLRGSSFKGFNFHFPKIDIRSINIFKGETITIEKE